MSETISAATARQSRDGSRGAAFARLIADARRGLGWTQDDLIFRAGVSRSTLARWEAGAAERPDPDAVRAVCGALSIDPKQALIALGYLTDADLQPAA